MIADSLDVTRGDTLIEIGPGIGFLTKYLSDTGARIIAVELDSDAVSDLQEQLFPNLEVIHADFLKFDLDTVEGPFKVAGNVPYQITTPIVARLFGDTRDYSQITLLTNFFAEARILAELNPEEFFPSPNVRSAVVEFTPFKEPPIQCNNYKLLRQLIKSGFSQRRKMLRNNLGFLKLSDAELANVFRELNLDPQVRAEKLSLQKYCQFANLIDAR